MKDVFSYFFGGMAVAMVIYLFVWMITPAPDLAKDAFDSYLAGEKAATVAERKEKFNQALEEYKSLEAAYDPQRGDGVLYYNIANSYFQLEEYPWAVYYYYKALKLSPKDFQIQNNLNAALGELELPPLQEATLLQRLFLLKGFSLPSRFQIFFYSALVFFAGLGAFLWFHDKRIFNLVIIAGVIALYFFLNTFYESYISAPEGVMVKAAALYREPGEQFAKVSEEYILPGVKVEVLDQRQDGRWLKVVTPSGQLGYVTAESLRLL